VLHALDLGTPTIVTHVRTWRNVGAIYGVAMALQGGSIVQGGRCGGVRRVRPIMVVSCEELDLLG
jgi:hypothetical protein